MIEKNTKTSRLLFTLALTSILILSAVTIAPVGKCEKKDLAQTLKYEDWLIKKKCSGDSEMVRSVIVAHPFDTEVIDYVKKRAEIEGKIVGLITYRADSSGNVKLKDVEQYGNLF